MFKRKAYWEIRAICLKGSTGLFVGRLDMYHPVDNGYRHYIYHKRFDTLKLWTWGRTPDAALAKAVKYCEMANGKRKLGLLRSFLQKLYRLKYGDVGGIKPPMGLLNANRLSCLVYRYKKLMWRMESAVFKYTLIPDLWYLWMLESERVNDIFTK